MTTTTNGRVKTDAEIDAEVLAGAEAEAKGPTPPTPKKRAARKTGTGAKTGRKPKSIVNAEERARRVTALYEQIGAGILLAASFVGNTSAMAAGEAMQDNAAEIGAAWAKAADANDKIAKVIDNLTTGGAFGALLLAHAPIALAVINGPAEDSAAGGLADIMSMFTTPAPAPV